MPRNSTHQKKRNGLHHRRSHGYLKTYLPYLPLVVSIAISLVVSNWQPPRHGTLAYATEMSLSSLLQSTNSERESNGKADLELNQQLNNAAQAKANDMVTRNYWSHNTPDGQEPWVFMSNAGYHYSKAGENLAYGFNTSNDTVVGWMNSAPHRQNLLDGDFSQVGFGFVNGNNYNNSGPETVVVAMYGKPQTLGASTGQSAAPAAPQPAPKAQVSKPVPAAPPSNTAPAPVATSAAPTPTPAVAVPLTIPSVAAKPVSRIQGLTGGHAPWTLLGVAMLSGSAIILLLLKHGLALRHVLVRSERLVLRQLHHPLFDSILLSIIIVSLSLSHTIGYIG